MKRQILLVLGFFIFIEAPFCSETGFTARQTTEEGVSIVRLRDSKRDMDVTILPLAGNIASELKIHGQNILFFPDIPLAAFHKNPVQTGIPFLAPWANRLDETGFWANGTKYKFDMDAGNIRNDGNGFPLHGVSGITQWEVVRIGSDQRSAYVTSRFVYWKRPDLMSQWPFAHEYELTYRLADGALEVQTTVINLSTEPMPLAIGFHPYYRIPGIPRDEWVLRMPARKAVVADARRLPTGEYRALDLPNPLPLKGRTLDDGFTDFEQNALGQAKFSIESGEKKIELLFGPKYPVAVVWEPATASGQSMPFLCVEPMAGITNAINLYQAGKYSSLQTIPAGGKWSESFWIRPEGF